MQRIYIFIVLFVVVFFLESIGASYIYTALQSIERQFQMSSGISGLLVSATECGYIPCVVIMSYFGSKGNRSRWIGGGVLLMSITYLMLGTPNFLFPTRQQKTNGLNISESLRPTPSQLLPNSTLKDLLSYPLMEDQLPSSTYQFLLNLTDDKTPIEQTQTEPTEQGSNPNVTFGIDGYLMKGILIEADNLVKNNYSQNSIKQLLSMFIHRRVNRSIDDIQKMKTKAVVPFTVCGKLTNFLRASIENSKCRAGSSNIWPFLVFFVSLFFLGVGRTIPWNLGIPLLDDNIKKKHLPMYFGAIASIRVLGPICGYLIGSFSNQFYYTLQAPSGLTPVNQGWIGAWWLGFLLIGALSMFPSLLLFFFPQGKNSTLQLREIRENKNGRASESKPIKMKIKEFVISCKSVLGTKIFTGCLLGRVCDIFAFKGYVVFLPKYLETQFGIPQYLVHRYMSMFGVFGFGLGIALGGFITKKFRLTGRQTALLMMIVSVLNITVYSSKIFIGCNLIVNSIGLNSRELNYNFTNECNSQCSCENAHLYPVCSADGTAYFSPCHAGCREATQFGSDPVIGFASCECVESGVVSKSFCQNKCQFSSILFLATVLLGSFVAGVAVVPDMLILLRSVDVGSRSLSMGLQGMAISLFGTLPSSIIWGLVIDTACRVWDKTCNGANGSCSIYDSDHLRIWMHLLYVGVRFISLLSDIYVWKNAGNLKIMDDPVADNIEALSNPDKI